MNWKKAHVTKIVDSKNDKKNLVEYFEESAIHIDRIEREWETCNFGSNCRDLYCRMSAIVVILPYLVCFEFEFLFFVFVKWKGMENGEKTHPPIAVVTAAARISLDTHFVLIWIVQISLSVNCPLLNNDVLCALWFVFHQIRNAPFNVIRMKNEILIKSVKCCYLSLIFCLEPPHLSPALATPTTAHVNAKWKQHISIKHKHLKRNWVFV